MPDRDHKGIAGLPEEDYRAPSVPAPMPRPGDEFAGRYRIQRQVGRGGMGEVFLAIQAPLQRTVAVKILKPPQVIEDDPKFDARFLREAAAAAQLNHPNTITIHDFGQTEVGQLYIVMEYLDGTDLKTALFRGGRFSAARAIHVAAQVCKSLREAHEKGIIHRDLKPANVLLVHRDDDEDFVKVVDFGLVKFRGEDADLTLAGKFVGSPKYTSPDALDRNVEVDHRADIYSLGVLLFTMITGAPPFLGDPMQVLTAHLNEKPREMWKANEKVEQNPALEALVARCLEKSPDARFSSMEEVLLALQEVDSRLTGEERSQTLSLDESGPVEAAASASSDEPKITRVRPGRPGPGNRLLVGASLLVVTGILLFAWWRWQSSPVVESVEEQGVEENLPAPRASGATAEGEAVGSPELKTVQSDPEEALENPSPDPGESAPGKSRSQEVQPAAATRARSQQAPTRKKKEKKAAPSKRPSAPSKEKSGAAKEVPDGYKDNPY